MERLLHLLVGGIELAQTQVVADGTAEQGVTLRHIDEVAAHTRGERLMDVVVVDFHLALLRFHQRKNHPHERGLSGTCLAQDGRATAGFEIERQVVDHIATTVLIGIAHIREPYAARRLHIDGLALLLERVLLQFHQALGGSEHIYELWHQAGEVPGRILHTVDELEESRHTTKGKRMVGEPDGRPQESDKVSQ